MEFLSAKVGPRDGTQGNQSVVTIGLELTEFEYKQCETDGWRRLRFALDDRLPGYGEILGSIPGRIDLIMVGPSIQPVVDGSIRPESFGREIVRELQVIVDNL